MKNSNGRASYCCDAVKRALGRYRWPDGICDVVLAHLLTLNTEPAKRKRERSTQPIHLLGSPANGKQAQAP